MINLIARLLHIFSLDPLHYPTMLWALSSLFKNTSPFVSSQNKRLFKSNCLTGLSLFHTSNGCGKLGNRCSEVVSSLWREGEKWAFTDDVENVNTQGHAKTPLSDLNSIDKQTVNIMLNWVSVHTFSPPGIYMTYDKILQVIDYTYTAQQFTVLIMLYCMSLTGWPWMKMTALSGLHI